MRGVAACAACMAVVVVKRAFAELVLLARPVVVVPADLVAVGGVADGIVQRILLRSRLTHLHGVKLTL